ncbi:MAG: hypothetical protein AAF149_25365 [Bacteroidota bacterium]
MECSPYVCAEGYAAGARPKPYTCAEACASAIPSAKRKASATSGQRRSMAKDRTDIGMSYIISIE